MLTPGALTYKGKEVLALWERMGLSLFCLNGGIAGRSGVTYGFGRQNALEFEGRTKRGCGGRVASWQDAK